MYTYSTYRALCRECGDMSLLSKEDKAIHIQAAKSHHESVGHTCEVLEREEGTIFYGKAFQIVSYNDFHVIATFGTE